ncbi:hypothetical protein QTP70_008259 [Hemibagrus guttatus]|uniref:Retrotransposon gag domain-containing protein n=1 Tax=Hemibagrus guttatus TaxID=175788 RepID=A0AAE0RIT6_9TELE|nr:hypothetical protein QTP70_008259 [Hemibagrus guttatus]
MYQADKTYLCYNFSQSLVYCFPITNFLPVPDYAYCSPPIASSANGSTGSPPLLNTSPITDPAELREIIVRQGAVIRSYQDQVEVLHGQLHSASTAALREPPLARGESPRLAMPEKFDGSADRCRGFLRQCVVFFSHQLGMYHEEGTICAFLLLLLSSRALEWASAVWDADPQGSEAAADYAIWFRTLAAQSGWNDAALWDVFCAGLNPALQTELACHMEATSLSQFVATAIRLDNLWRQHRTSASAATRMRTDYPGRGEGDPEPMQLGRSRLAEQERRPRGQMRRCYNCRSSSHLSPRCLERPSSTQVGGRPLVFSLTVPVSLHFSDRCVHVSALIDSGVAINLIDGALVEELGIPTSLVYHVYGLRPSTVSQLGRATLNARLSCWGSRWASFITNGCRFMLPHPR